MGFMFAMPLLEFLHSGGFVEQTQFYTTQQVLQVQHTLKAQDTTNSIGGLSSFVQPIQCSLAIQLNGCRDSQGIVRTEFLDEFTVAGAAAICHNNEVKR